MKTNNLKAFLIAVLFMNTFLNGKCGDGTKLSPYKIFWIGNSNTFMWGWYPKDKPKMALDPALPKYVKEMAENAPRPVYMDYSFQMSGGKDLEWHWLNGAQDSIKKGGYDFVVLNDLSTITFTAPEKFQKYSKLFDSLCKALGAKPIFFMGWPDDNEWNIRRDVIINSYDSLANNLNSEMAPLGRAWELVEKRKPTLNIYQDDLHHPNELGVYMNTCVFYSIITNTSPVATPYIFKLNWAKPTAENLDIIRNAAWDASRERLDPVNEIKLSYKVSNMDHVSLYWSKPAGTIPALYAVYHNATKIYYTTDTILEISDANPDMFHTYSVLGLKSDTLPLYNSNGISFAITDVEAPSVPSNLNILATGTNYVFIQWDACQDNVAVKEYILYLNGVEYKRTASTKVQLINLQAGIEYKVQVAASDAIPNLSSKSEIFSFTFEAQTSLSGERQDVDIYPNPASEYIIVSIEDINEGQIKIINSSGVLISNTKIIAKETRMNLSGLAKGVYVVQIVSDQQTTIKKIVIE